MEAGAVTGSEAPNPVGSKARSRCQGKIILRYNISFDKTHSIR